MSIKPRNSIISNYYNFINSTLNKNIVNDTIEKINLTISANELKKSKIDKNLVTSIKKDIEKEKSNKNKLNEEIEELENAITEYREMKNDEDFDLNFKSIYNVINYKNELISNEEEFKAFDYNTLHSKLIKSYNNKSFKSFKYFLFNISQKRNKRTNIPLVDFSENEELFIPYKKSLTYDENCDYKFTKEYIKGRYLEQVDNNYAMKKLAKVQYLESINKKRYAYFLTFTCPSQYHKYKMKDGLEKDERHYRDINQLTLNENFNHRDYNFEDSIEDSIKLMASVNSEFSELLRKNLYLQFQKRRRHLTSIEISKMEFESKSEKNKTRKLIYKEMLKKIHYKRDKIAVIEPHKSMVAHSHYLQWVDYEDKEVVYNTFSQIIKKFKLNRQFCKIVKINSKRAKPTTYLTKYLTKNYNKENAKEESNFYNIYKRYFCSKSKFFTTSDFNYTTQKRIDIMYSFLKKNCKKLLEQIREKEISLYRYLEFMDKKGIFTFKEKSEIKYAFVKSKIKKLFNKYVRIELKEKKKEYIQKINDLKSLYKYTNKNDWYYEEIKESIKNVKKEYIEIVKDRKKKALNSMKEEFNIFMKDFTKEYKYKYINETFINLNNRGSKIFNNYIGDIILSRYEFTTKKKSLLLTTPIKYNFKIQERKLYEDRTISDISYFDTEINNRGSVEYTDEEINDKNFNMCLNKKAS